MFKNMKLGAKIAFGFGLLMALSAVLGLVGVINMRSVGVQASRLDKGYVPEVESAAQLQENALKTMYNMRGYAYTEDEAFYKNAETELVAVDKELGDLSQLIKDADFLIKLKEDHPIAKAAVDEYKSLAEQTKAVNKALEGNRSAMDDAAKRWSENCYAYLESQNGKLAAEYGAGAAKVSDRHTKITNINDIIDLGNSARIGNFKSQALRDPEIFKKALENFGPLYTKVDELLPLTKTEEDRKNLENVKNSASDYEKAMKEFLANWLKREELGKKRNEVAEKVLESSDSILSAGLEAMNTKMEAANSSIAVASMIMIIGLFAAVGLGIAVAIIITRSITGPVNRIIVDLSNGAEQVGSASGQVSAASQSLAEGAAEQASSLEEVSSSLEEMSSMTRQNADNADQANNLAKQSRQSANNGNEATKKMIEAMQRMNASAQETQKIIKTIDEIAFQTNLLALNAAVEAARAGEAGKGFAVVAEEVRNLAQRAGEAARNTAQLIEESVVNTQNGGKIANEMAGALKEITEGAGKVSELVAEIAAASKEQAQGIDQVNVAVGQMDKVTQQNASNAEESASASEELNAQAQQMKDVVGELVALVGGNTETASSVSRSISAPRTAHHLDFSHVKKLSAGKGKPSAAPRRPVKATSNDMETMIPFKDKDEDFNEF